MLMKVGADTVRQQNRALVLAALRRRGPLSHTDLSGWTGLSSSSVSAITSALENDGVLVRQERPTKLARGRPRVLFQHNPAAAYLAAIRITSEEIEYSLVDYAGTLKDRFSVTRLAQEHGTEEFKAAFTAGLERLAERAQLAPHQVTTISITSKGLVAQGQPRLLWSPILGDQVIDFEAILRPRWRGRVLLTHDTRFAASAIASRWRRDGLVPKVGQIITLSLSHSIGLGIAKLELDGQISSVSPHFGHMVHLPNGPLCRCGSRGCIESVAGFYGILRTAFEVPEDTIPAKFIPLEEMNKIAARAEHGDRMAQYAFRQAGAALGIGISRLHSLMGMMPVAITGPGARYFSLMRAGFEPPIRESLQARFTALPEIKLVEDETGLIHDGNVEASLADLDAMTMAARRGSDRLDKEANQWSDLNSADGGME